jgi:hypothetical protein
MLQPEAKFTVETAGLVADAKGAGVGAPVGDVQIQGIPQLVSDILFHFFNYNMKFWGDIAEKEAYGNSWNTKQEIHPSPGMRLILICRGEEDDASGS